MPAPLYSFEGLTCASHPTALPSTASRTDAARLGYAAASILALSVVTACAEHPQADVPQDPFSSIEEAAERLAPYADPEAAAGLAGPPHCYSTGSPLDWHVPQIEQRLLSDGDAAAEVSAWIFPDAETASGHLDDALENLAGCGTVNLDLGDTFGEARSEFHPFADVGWSGGQAIAVVEEGRVGPESTASLNHRFVAARGVTVVSIEWELTGETAEDPKPVPRSADETAEDTARDLLLLLGGNPDRPAPEQPDPAAPSNQAAAAMLPLDHFHPQADSHEPGVLDLLCSSVDAMEPSSSGQGPGWLRALSAEATYMPASTGSEPAAATDGPSTSVAVVEAYSLEADTDTARQRSDEWVGLEPATGGDGESRWPPTHPCDSWWIHDGTGGSSSADNPHADEPVDLVPMSAEPIEANGWTGAIETMGVRYANAPADAPTSESVVQVRASLWHDNSVIYLRYQTGGGDDLDSSLATARQLVVDSISALTA